MYATLGVYFTSYLDMIGKVKEELARQQAEKGRSQWRIDGMRWNFDKVIIPFFGAPTPVSSITTDQVQKLVIQRKRTVKPKTVWHDITNLRARSIGQIEEGKPLLSKKSR